MPAQPHLTSNKPSPVARPPLLPYVIAGLFCLMLALALGYGAWRIFAGRSIATGPSGKPVQGQSRTSAGPSPTVSVDVAQKDESAASHSTAQPTPLPSDDPPLPGMRYVPAGMVKLGGENTGQPVQRYEVKPFFISETEVTEDDYAGFVRETSRNAPTGWMQNIPQPGTGNEPVTNVTWQDAVDYCDWLGKKTGLTVRLPTEAEWTRAASGDQNFKYPWGNEWKQGAAVSLEKQVSAVKSRPDGVSPFGVYDMAGNVYEWVSDDGETVVRPPGTTKRAVLRGKIIKGGSYLDGKSEMTTVWRVASSPDEAYQWLGFRCVVQRGDEAR